MYRTLTKELYRWKEAKDRKPLLLKGVRQSGKTYLLKEFGKKAYSNIAYFNFEGNEPLQQCFDRDIDPQRIISELGVFNRRAIKPDDTLVIFDEIQFCNRALTALKYFCEDAPQYHIACAGSLLGIALSKPLSFPVGKADMRSLRPLSFHEFMLANREEELAGFLAELPVDKEVPEIFTVRLSELLRNYYVAGGMPEAYQRLLLDVLHGDASLFSRSDEVELAWGIVDPIARVWASAEMTEIALYEAGGWGPPTSTEWMRRQGREWFDMCPVLH